MVSASVLLILTSSLLSVMLGCTQTLAKKNRHKRTEKLYYRQEECSSVDRVQYFEFSR